MIKVINWNYKIKCTGIDLFRFGRQRLVFESLHSKSACYVEASPVWSGIGTSHAHPRTVDHGWSMDEIAVLVSHAPLYPAIHLSKANHLKGWDAKAPA